MRPLPGWESFTDDDGLSGYRRRSLGIEIVLAGNWAWMRVGPHSSARLMYRTNGTQRDGRELAAEQLLGPRLHEAIADLARSAADAWRHVHADVDTIAAHMALIARAGQTLSHERDARQGSGASPWT